MSLDILWSALDILWSTFGVLWSAFGCLWMTLDDIGVSPANGRCTLNPIGGFLCFSFFMISGKSLALKEHENYK